MGDIAAIDKVRFTGPPPRHNPNPTGQGAGNPVILPAYTFIPRKPDRSRKHPLLVLVHGGVHSNFSSSAANIVRELIELGYAIIAPEYRGSTGYGGGFYRQDEDVNVLEVESLIRALQAEGKKFEYKIYQNAPGGHSFNRLDTRLARESRAGIYKFLGQYLKP